MKISIKEAESMSKAGRTTEDIEGMIEGAHKKYIKKHKITNNIPMDIIPETIVHDIIGYDDYIIQMNETAYDYGRQTLNHFVRDHLLFDQNVSAGMAKAILFFNNDNDKQWMLEQGETANYGRDLGTIIIALGGTSEEWLKCWKSHVNYK